MTNVEQRRITKTSFALLVVAMLCLCVAPLSSEAKGKPETTGQERAASVGNKSSNEATSNAEEGTGVEEGEEGDDDGVSEKLRGHDRAKSVIKREEIQNQISMIHMLIQQMKDAIDGKGIGRELSEFIHNGRILPDVDTGDDDGDSSILSASLISSVETLIENEASTADDDQGEFEMELSITASSGDLMIPMTAAIDDATTTGVVFSIRVGSSTDVASGTIEAVLSSSATTSGDSFVVAQGETETFTVTITFDPDVSDAYYAQLETVNTDQGSVGFTPAEAYQSEELSL